MSMQVQEVDEDFLPLRQPSRYELGPDGEIWLPPPAKKQNPKTVILSV